MTLNKYDAANTHVRTSIEACARLLVKKKAARTLDAEFSVLRSARVHARRLSKRAAWCCACLWDGVDQNAPFVTWTETNPYAARYDSLTAV